MTFMRRIWRRHNNIAAQRLAVRPHWPWRFKLLLAALGGLLLLLAMWLVFGYGYRRGEAAAVLAQPRPDAPANDPALAERWQRNEQARELLKQQLQVESSTREQLAAELKHSQQELARVREESRFFETLLTAPSRSTGLALESFLLTALSGGQYHYRLLLVQGMKGEAVFQGNYDLLLHLKQGPAVPYPGNGQRLPVEVRRYARLERDMTLADGGEIVRVDVRIYPAGSTRPQLSRSFLIKEAKQDVQP